MAYRELVGGVRDALFDTGSIRAIRDLLPTRAIEAFGFVTHLGDGALLTSIAVSCYWFRHDRRPEYAFVIGAGLGAFALVAGLKALFVNSRPPEEFHMASETNYGFPSAHTLGSTVVWGLLAVVSEVGTRKSRYLGAGIVIAAVSLSRIVIGVHYPGDVLGGVSIGAAYLAVVLRYADRRPLMAFAGAVGLAVMMAIIAPNRYTPATVGGSTGALLAWAVLRDIDVSPSLASIGIVLSAVVPAAFGVRAFALEVESETETGAGAVIEAVGYAVVVAATLTVPRAAAGIESSDPVRALRWSLQ